MPDTFRDVPDIDVGVTVEGELQADDSFEATSVLAKCPSKYEMQQRKEHGEQMPHGPLAARARGPEPGNGCRRRRSSTRGAAPRGRAAVLANPEPSPYDTVPS